ncbi:DNA replication complex GINS protein PSF1-like [Salvia hispanica]|uniref:DNA replication complex GINS protein PSF1-like n=1 Tax=Salvia hispanica TaxID=49212 RepID=UPI00200969A0|nr:DNA replication complex GINS protein PSF1-like [Salvia hispanica]XP_047964392.1 DNA replication complex GINS protein PSF1-like [Salvia hispanica]
MRKIQEHENNLKDKRSLEEEIGISEDGTSNTEAEKKLIQNALKSDQFGALVHHLSLVRNKRCLMAYVYKRAEVIRSLGWMVDSVLPEEIQEKLGTSEKEYFKNHAATLQSYMAELDLHLTVDMIPPKDPLIKVRVLDDIGGIALSDQVANLSCSCDELMLSNTSLRAEWKSSLTDLIGGRSVEIVLCVEIKLVLQH